jgi:hypothetical protein
VGQSSLVAGQQAIEKALLQLRRSARDFLFDMVENFRQKQRRNLELKHWTKIGKLADALTLELDWLAHNTVNAPDPDDETHKPYDEQLQALMKIRVMARGRMVNSGGRIDDGYPKTTPKAKYHSEVLDVWTELGGKLKFSRHPRTGKIKGPLARYFAAITQPVHGGSPESLPDIINRHLADKAALDKWRLDTFITEYQP